MPGMVRQGSSLKPAPGPDVIVGCLPAGSLAEWENLIDGFPRQAQSLASTYEGSIPEVARDCARQAIGPCLWPKCSCLPKAQAEGWLRVIPSTNIGGAEESEKAKDDMVEHLREEIGRLRKLRYDQRQELEEAKATLAGFAALLRRVGSPTLHDGGSEC